MTEPLRSSTSFAPRVFVVLSALCLYFVFPATANARIGEHWSKAKGDMFFRFFMADSLQQSPNAIVLHPWTKRYRNTVTLRVSLGADSLVTAIELTLDRKELESDWMTMRGIAKNFLREEIDLRDSLRINDLANEIEYYLDHGVQFAGDIPRLPSQPGADYQTFLNTQPSATDAFEHSSLLLWNDSTPALLHMKLATVDLAGPLH